MVKETTSPGKYHYYTLPLEKGTVTLTLKTLNKHSEFRFSERPYLVICRRTISFQNEVLILGIRLGEEKEERVYIRLLQTELRISCSVDTDHTHLSRYAYFALYQFVSFGSFNFDKYYWPDFFSPKTGKSKYLNIIIDRAGTDIKRKSKYAFFYKPGQKLIYPFKHTKAIAPPVSESQTDHINLLNRHAIGYCFADTSLGARYSNHFPFLLPYTGIWKQKKDGIKGFHSFIITSSDILSYDYTPLQDKINALGQEMAILAPIQMLEYKSSEKEKQAHIRDNLKKLKLVYTLWQKAIPLLQGQPLTHFLFTHGMRFIKKKPRKQDMHPCIFSGETPQLCFLLVNKGDYYELEMRFKVNGKMYVPNECNPTFFIHSTTEPYLFYLLDSITDYRVTSFFARHYFKLSVLKCHYQPYFKKFTDRLATVYELKAKEIEN
ncbi:hypothetical protein [Pedobacter sp. L105]|uniref:hypothetical protein n=1 Tax=Pedobacter sp. L105 TaxID=1641871 RepID=UPI00131B16EE|nr:hypothetical protein [Pedobacter sp. L105]